MGYRWGMRPGRLIPQIPHLAKRILDTATPLGECLISSRTPALPRPYVHLPAGGQVSAYRVVMAVELGRDILPEEDVHHRCRVPRCVLPAHLEVQAAPDHSEHHALEQTQDICSVHQEPYARRNAKGWGVCRRCTAEATERWRQRNPEKVAQYKASEAGIQSRRTADRRSSQKPETKARKAREQRERRARRRTQAGLESQ